MSVSDPLLKRLKGYIIELRQEKEPITDRHPSLQPFCETVELILRKGLKKSSSILPWNKRDYWHWIQQLVKDNEHIKQQHLRLNPSYCVAVESVQKSARLKTIQGRGRCFIRLGLQKKVFHVALEGLQQNAQFRESFYDYLDSIIGDEILCEMFLSLIHQANEIDFKLHIRNASFLDQTWLIPAYRRYELVPCKDLGVGVHFVDGWALVTHIDPAGVAGEDGKVEVGDILEEICGKHLKGASKSTISTLLQDLQGWPITLGVIKGVYEDGRLYPPIWGHLRSLEANDPCLKKYLEGAEEKAEKNKQIKPPHAMLSDDELDQVPVQSPDGMATYEVQYLGNVLMGSNGGMVHIEKGLETVLNASKKRQEALLELGEKDVITRLVDSDDILMHHSYTEISSCGRRVDYLDYFAYIVGDTTCTIAKQFICHVFQARNDDESKVILCTVAQGFERTHWFV